MLGTRETIIKVFTELLDEKPIKSITVKDIVERCNINRNTFYYHFQDIPSLVRGMLEEKVDQLIANHYYPGQPIECIRPLIQYGIKNKRAVLHVYRYIPREVFLSYLDRLALRLMQEYFSTATEGVSVPGENVDALILFYKCSMVGLLLDWLDKNLEADMPALMERLCVLLQGSGRSALMRCAT